MRKLYSPRGVPAGLSGVLNSATQTTRATPFWIALGAQINSMLSAAAAQSSILRDAVALGRHAAPAGRRQAGGLLEPAGEVALVREAAILGDLRQFLVAGEQVVLGLVDLALEQELLRREAEQLGKAAVEV